MTAAPLSEALRARAEIDLGALRANYRALKALAPRSRLMAVVKAQAYGHGAVEVARALVGEGCGLFAVATLGEARELRQAGIKERVFLLGGFFAEQADAVVELDLTPVIFDLALIAPLEAAARRFGKSTLAVHLKLDTGATRLGILPEELEDAIGLLRRAPHLELEGLATLLANAADPASPVTDRQLAAFGATLGRLRQSGFKPIGHVANSAALALRADSHFDIVRPGLSLYGLPPVREVAEKVVLRPVMTFKARLLQVKRVPAGTGVSYGQTFVTSRPSRIGVVGAGYADGYRRGLQAGAHVLVRARRAPVVGAVCMDLTMVDLTEVDGAGAGDEVVLWGTQGDQTISVNEVARIAQTISYEMLCTVGRRVERIYRDSGAQQQ